LHYVTDKTVLDETNINILVEIMPIIPMPSSLSMMEVVTLMTTVYVLSKLLQIYTE